MTADTEKLREDVARAIWGAHNDDMDWDASPSHWHEPYFPMADAAIALIWPAAMREAAACQPSTAENPNENAYQRGRFDGVMEFAKAILALSLLSPDAEKECTDWFLKQDFYQLEHKGACPICGCEEVDHRNLWTCRCPAPRSPDAEKEEGR